MDDPARIAALRSTDFEPLVGTDFTLTDGADHQTRIRLIEVRSVVGSDPEQERPSFGLLFRGTFDVKVTQGTYLFEHPQMAPFELFLVPVAPDAAGRRYEVILN